MASLESLTPDQRAVLDLVLRRGRSYDDIAQLLAIDRAAVRARALAAFDAIGPETGISPESRALVTDYLLGQLPERVAEQTRERLAGSPYDRAWARVVASELEPLAAEPLPEIPDGSRARSAPAASSEAEATAPKTRTTGSEAEPREARRRPRLSDRPSSRRGGAIMLGVGVLVVVVVVVVLLALTGGGSSKKQPTTAASNSSTAHTSTAGSTTGTTGTKSQAQIVAQVNLNPPSATGSSKGVGLVVKDGNAYGLIIEAQNVAANSHNAYAVWLYNSSTDTVRLGFVNPAVGKTGKLQVGTGLPTNAGHYKELLLTLETQSNPKTPGQVVLEGAFKGVPATG
jgi:hypothetical protein